MITYIDDHKASHGVEPICRLLEIAPSTYYAAKRRPPSARTIADAHLAGEVARVHADNLGVYGVRKTWRALAREGVSVGRDRTWRLMRALGLAGVTRSRRVRTTIPAPVAERPADLVNRTFAAPAPDRLWVADIERHEALTNRAVMKGHRRQPVAAGWRSWGQPDPGDVGEGGKQPRQRRDGPALSDGPGPASKTGRCT